MSSRKIYKNYDGKTRQLQPPDNCAFLAGAGRHHHWSFDLSRANRTFVCFGDAFMVILLLIVGFADLERVGRDNIESFVGQENNL
jgi:hypothetical protein